MLLNEATLATICIGHSVGVWSLKLTYSSKPIETQDSPGVDNNIQMMPRPSGDMAE